MIPRYTLWSVVILLLASPAAAEHFDTLIAGGLFYDGTSRSARRADLGIRGERVAAVGDLADATAGHVVQVDGRAVAPGFINVLSWANESLIADGRGMSDTKQGVTLEIFGEGWSMGPLNDRLKDWMRRNQSDIRFDIEWTTLGEYLEFLERRGITPMSPPLSAQPRCACT